MPKQKICEVCNKHSSNMICVQCVERDVGNWKNKWFKEGKTQALKKIKRIIDECQNIRNIDLNPLNPDFINKNELELQIKSQLSNKKVGKE